LVGAADGELGQLAGHAGAEVKQHQVIEAAQQRHQLSVGFRAQTGHHRGVAGRAEQMQPGRQRRHVGAQLGGGVELLEIGQQVGQRQR
jgi:hypothetical protein